MARSNKYSSLNLNGIFEKKLNNNQSASNSSSAKSFQSQGKPVLSNSRIHGHMLVLSRPAPKPSSTPQKPENKDKGSISSSSIPDQAQATSESGSISLRPQGRTGTGPLLSSPPLPSPVSPLPSPVKSGRFVPPHRRPGFVGREEKPGPELVKGGQGSFKGKQEVRGPRPGQAQGLGDYGSDTIERRPKSGGGYEPIRRRREQADLNRPGSGGTRPSSSG